MINQPRVAELARLPWENAPSTHPTPKAVEEGYASESIVLGSADFFNSFRVGRTFIDYPG